MPRVSTVLMVAAAVRVSRECALLLIVVFTTVGITCSAKAIPCPSTAGMQIGPNPNPANNTGSLSPCDNLHTVLTPIRSLKIGSLRNERSASDRNAVAKYGLNFALF
jgi:hypothetical protein